VRDQALTSLTASTGRSFTETATHHRSGVLKSHVSPLLARVISKLQDRAFETPDGDPDPQRRASRTNKPYQRAWPGDTRPR